MTLTRARRLTARILLILLAVAGAVPFVVLAVLAIAIDPEESGEGAAEAMTLGVIAWWIIKFIDTFEV